MLCILCDGRFKDYLIGFDNTHTSTRDSFEIIKCDKCGLEKTIVSAKQLGKYYPKNYYSYVSGLSWMEKLLRAKYDDLQNKKNSLAKHFLYGKLIKYPCKIGGGKFLDIGCGNNSHFSFLQKYGWDCSGFEIGEGGWKDQIFYGPNILTFDSNDKYNRITLRHVLEHFDNPLEYIKKITSLMKDDAKLVVSVPNYNSRYAKLFGSYWYNRDIPRHLYNWSPKTLALLGEYAGLKVEKIYHQSLFSGANSLLLLLTYKCGISNKFISILRPFLYVLFIPFDLLSNLFKKGDVVTVIYSKF